MWVVVARTYQYIAKHTGTRKCKRHISQSVRRNWTKPVGLVMKGGAETVESRYTKHNHNNHKYQTEFWLIDTVVTLGQAHADVVV